MAEARNDAERVALRFFEVLNTGDLELIRTQFHEEATWTPMVKGVPGAGEHVGLKGIVDEFLAPVRGLFVEGDPKNTIESIASNGPFVMLETHGRGTLSDGRTYDNRYAWAIEVKDGKVFRLREYMDSAYVAALFAEG